MKLLVSTRGVPGREEEVRLLDAMEELPMPIEAGYVALEAVAESILDSPTDIDPAARVPAVIIDESSVCLRPCTEDSPITNGFAVTRSVVPKLFMEVPFKTSELSVSWPLDESEPRGIVVTGDLETGSMVETCNKFVPCNFGETARGTEGANTIGSVMELIIGVGLAAGPDACDCVGWHDSVEAGCEFMAHFTAGADSGDPGRILP